MKAEIMTPRCDFRCEMVVDSNDDLEYKGIRKIHDESIGLFLNFHYKFVSISDFKNAAGESIGDYLLEHHPEFANLLLKN